MWVDRSKVAAFDEGRTTPTAPQASNGAHDTRNIPPPQSEDDFGLPPAPGGGSMKDQLEDFR
jgi:hypothetical protein